MSKKPSKASPKTQESTVQRGFVTVTLKLPAAALDPTVYRVRHIELQLTTDQSDGLRRLLDGLNAASVKLLSGRFVQTPADVIRYMLEQIGS